jgi:hypothetical protein
MIPFLAVRVGFEPTVPVRVQRFSRPPDSTTLAPHLVSNLAVPLYLPPLSLRRFFLGLGHCHRFVTTFPTNGPPLLRAAVGVRITHRCSYVRIAPAVLLPSPNPPLHASAAMRTCVEKYATSRLSIQPFGMPV